MRLVALHVSLFESSCLYSFALIARFSNSTASKPLPKSGNTLIDTDNNHKKSKDSNRGFQTADDGRLIIAEPKRNGRGARNDSGSDDEDFDMNAAAGEAANKKLAGKKRSLADDSSDSDEEDVREGATGGPARKRAALDAQSAVSGRTGASSNSRYVAGGRGIHRPTNSGAASVRSGATGRSMGAASAATTSKAGSAFKAKKAGGDVKKGQLDPYAYIPLSRSSMNKRYEAAFIVGLVQY